MIELDPILIARIQYAFTISFHIIFPAFTIGLASWLAVVEWLWLRTENPIYQEIYRMWIKIFAVCFGMGVVSGIVMAYQFGTNWSLFSDKVGNVIGPLLGYEVLTAFFLEASFLGIMLFGWGRVSRNMHFFSTCIVAVGTLISAFWILSANSWMQTPQGFEIRADGLLYPTSWLEIIFNPSFPYRFAHMITAAYLTTAFAVAGVAAYYLYKNVHIQHARIMFGMAMLMAIFVSPLQLFIGDAHGLNTLEYQPRKIAAIEGTWDTEKGAGLRLFAIPDQQNQTNNYEIIIPKLASLILTHSFDGETMIITGIFALFLYYRKRLFDTRWFQFWCIVMSPSGFIALLAGWFVTEIGRQPYTVYEVLRTSESISPVIGPQIAITLLAFVIVYSSIFGTACYYIIKLIKKGPKIGDEKEEFYDHSMLPVQVIKELTPKTERG